MSKPKKKGPQKMGLSEFVGENARDALPTAPSGLTEIPRGPGVWRGSAGAAGGAGGRDGARGPRRGGGEEGEGEEEEWRRFQKGKSSEDEPSRADGADQWRRGPSAASSSSSSSTGAYQARGGSRFNDREERGDRPSRYERGPRDGPSRDGDGGDGPAPARADEASEWRRSAPLESERPSRGFGGDRDRGGDRPRYGDRDGGDRPRYGNRDGGDRDRDRDRSSHFSSNREGGGEREFSRDMFGTAKVEERPRFGDRDDRRGGGFGDRDRRYNDRDDRYGSHAPERPRLNLQKRTVGLDGNDSKSESQAPSQSATPTTGTPPSEPAEKEQPKKDSEKENTDTTKEPSQEPSKELSKDTPKEPSTSTSTPTPASDLPARPKPKTDIFGREIGEPRETASGGPALAPIKGSALKKHTTTESTSSSSTSSSSRIDPFGGARRPEEPKKTTPTPSPAPAPKPVIPRDVDESLAKEGLVPVSQKKSALQKAMDNSEPVNEKQLNEGLARVDLSDTDTYVDLINCLVRSITDKKIAMSLETLSASLQQHQSSECADILCDVLDCLRTKKDKETMVAWVKASKNVQILPIIAGDRKDAELASYLTSKDLIELIPVPDLTDAITSSLSEGKSSDAVVSQINSSADEKVSVDYLIPCVISYLASRIYADKSKPDASSVTSYASLLKRLVMDLTSQKKLIYEFQLHWFNNGTVKSIFKEIFDALFKNKIIPIEAFIAWKEDTSDKGKNGKTKALLQVNSWIEEHTPKPKDDEEDEDDEDEDEEDDEYLSNHNRGDD